LNTLDESYLRWHLSLKDETHHIVQNDWDELGEINNIADTNIL